MPASDGLAPPLSEVERDIVKSHGGWTAFCASYGLEPWNPDENKEAKSLIHLLGRKGSDAADVSLSPKSAPRSL
ncbi:hypothetical protein VHUM_00031 [Vanrija humicola]|uniref:Uncharacterized protein n=1 Tax=Vanrija humicola TaxID=5417 RepID=A0A7D8V5H7_VANHU|nr:hypothetical protein VHUM_00031 [Vanrija humicola]